MKVVIRLIRGGCAEINAEPTDTIRVVKTKIEESPAPLGFAVDLQKIICSGEVLRDDRTLESYGFSENAKDKYLVLMVNQKNRPRTVPPNAQSMPTPLTNTATISSAEPSPSNFVRPSSQPTVPPNAPSIPTPPTSSATICSTEAGPSNSGVIVPSSVPPSSQSSAFNHGQSTPVTAQIVGIGPDEDQKVLATLEGSQIDDFEKLKTMGFSMQATVEAYLCCDKNVEHAARYLSENGGAKCSETSDQSNTRRAEIYCVDSKGDSNLVDVLEGSQIDDFEELQALGFSHNATVEAYILCDKDKERAANFLVENGNNSYSSSSRTANNVPQLSASLGGAEIDQIQQVEASTSDPKASPTSISETLGSLPTSSQKALGKRPERPWSSHSDDDRASKKTRTSENSATASSSMPPLPTSLLAEVSPTTFLADDVPSESMIIDDSKVEDNFSTKEKATINKLETMGFPREAVIDAICVCNGDEECTVEYLYENGYQI